MDPNHPSSPRHPTFRSGTRNQSFMRHSTHDSAHSTASNPHSRRTKSFKIQAKEKMAEKPKRYQQRIHAYADLTWDVIRNFLREKWPDEDFKEERRNDAWVFETPEDLTKEERKTITELRDNSALRLSSQRASVTPER
ncbi:hypothetical protein GGR54DRAFT_639672 [Hypoxylon sp. NC1633]|nr:hypothetical protein GGR54DRAFT_639672 [Hypoxylon sp. NC1633]